MTERHRQSQGPAGHDSLMSPQDNKRMFSSIAGRYDLMNSIMSMGLDRHWRRRAVRQLQPKCGGRYLDVGCGTGDMMIEILRQCSDAQVIGLDQAEGMLEIAAGRMRKAGIVDKVHFRLADGMELPFEDASFEGVVCAFCLRNMAHRIRAIAEMRRVLKPGGRVVVLELTVPSCAVMRCCHKLYTRWLLPLAGRLIAGSKEAYQYLVDSVEDFSTSADVLDMMSQAGFRETSQVAMNGGAVTVFIGEEVA